MSGTCGVGDEGLGSATSAQPESDDEPCDDAIFPPTVLGSAAGGTQVTPESPATVPGGEAVAAPHPSSPGV
jgi:hypothetical protein